jgi:hypothetical protein
VIKNKKPLISVVDTSRVESKENSLENDRYLVKINENGNIASIFDKKLQKELLRGDIAFQCLYNSNLEDEHRRNYPNWPEWEILPEGTSF